MTRVDAACLVCCLMIAYPAAAQLQGRFYLDKEKFVAGAPVYLHFEVTNTGNAILQIQTTSIDSFREAYLIKISDGSPALIHPSDGCADPIGGGSIGIGSAALGPGQSRVQNILLNFRHNLEKPGTYEVSATHELPYGTDDQIRRRNGPKLETTAHLRILIEQGDEAALKAIFQPYVADLTAKDGNRNAEAHRVITSTAPLFLEDMILEMLDSESTRGFAVATLRNMNTARSRKALAEIASGNGEWRDSANQYLGEMGDATYYPLVFRAAADSKPGSNSRQAAIRAAAQLGHDEFVPFLVKLLQSSEHWDRINAVQGMYESGSRQAVPPLIDLLRDHDDFIARMAAGVLVTLTHRTPVPDGPYEKDPMAQYPAWRHWWSSHSATAPIYGPRDCGEIEPLERAH